MCVSSPFWVSVSIQVGILPLSGCLPQVSRSGSILISTRCRPVSFKHTVESRVFELMWLREGPRSSIYYVGPTLARTSAVLSCPPMSTSTLFRCLPLLTVVSKNYGLNLEWIAYSRKDFTFPTDQVSTTKRSPKRASCESYMALFFHALTLAEAVVSCPLYTLDGSHVRRCKNESPKGEVSVLARTRKCRGKFQHSDRTRITPGMVLCL